MIDRRLALFVGAVVLGGVMAIVWWLLTHEPKAGHGQLPEPTASAPVPDGVFDGRRPVLALQQGGSPESRVRGVVVYPEGRPAFGAKVTLFRQLSAWPEWRRRPIAELTTGPNGRFEFDTPRGPDLLVGFSVPRFAGDVVEAPPSLPELTLRLRTGFTVQGFVSSVAGPQPGRILVSLESTLGDERIVRTTEASNLGQFEFTEVAMGMMRVVARHDSWQPAARNNLVVGADVANLELRFDRPAVSIEGVVLAAVTQEPVAGATILGLAAGQRFGRNQPAEATTRADGRFRLAGLAPGNLRLEVRHAGFATVVRTIVVGTSPSELRIDLPPRARLRGRLLADDAALYRGSVLTLRSAVDELVSTEVAEDGRFEFADAVTPGWAALSVPDGHMAFDSDAAVRQVLVEEGGGPLEMQVRPPAVVSGRVVDRSGAPIAGARVTASQVDMFLGRLFRAGNALLDVDLSKFGDQLTRTAGGEPEPLLAVTGGDGHFRIAGLMPGEVELRVVRPGFGSRVLGVVVPPCGETSGGHEVVLPRGCRISGTVRRGGRALPGVQVGVVVDGFAISAVTGLDGGYELLDLPPGEYKVRARFSTFPTVVAPNAARVEPAAAATVNLDFPPGRTVRGVVSGLDGQPVEGAMVHVRGQQGDPVYTDSSGVFELEAPRRQIELQVGLGDRGAMRAVAVPVDVDDVAVSIDAPPNCTVTGTVLGLPGKTQVQSLILRIARGGDDGPELESRWVELHSGQLRYPLFPAGKSRLTLWSEGYAPVNREVDLEAGEELELGQVLLEPGCQLEGVVLDDQGQPVPGAEVLVGEPSDLLVYQTQNRTDDRGRFVVRGVSTAASSLIVRAAGFAWRMVPLRLPQDLLAEEPLVVRVDPGSKIEIEVGGEDSVGTMLVLMCDGRVLATAEVGDDGLAVFDNRGVGDYVVQRLGDEREQAVVRVERSGQVLRVRLEGD